METIIAILLYLGIISHPDDITTTIILESQTDINIVLGDDEEMKKVADFILIVNDEIDF